MTDRSTQTEHTPTPAIILVRPQMGENIGAAARAMLNFGFDRMRLVAPRDGWPNPSAVAMASGAGRVLDGATVYDDLPSALEDVDFVLATTARSRELVKPVLTPEEAMARTRALEAEGKRVAILFGPERTGLENDDIARANAIVTFPVNPEFASINLAQSVLLTAYEYGRQGYSGPAEHMPMHKTEFASAQEVEALANHYEERLEESGFFYPSTKAPGMKVVLRNMWTRLPLTRADVQMLHGMLRQLLRGKSE